MKWYWTVRIYRSDGQYANAVVETDRVLNDIDVVQEFYLKLTGCKMLLEGMNTAPPANQILTLNEAFQHLWEIKQ